jgi:predicted helicase
VGQEQTTIHALLDQYARLARETQEKGLRLKKRAQCYLTTNPLWTARSKYAWLLQDWPGYDAKTDTGIDLVKMLQPDPTA